MHRPCRSTWTLCCGQTYDDSWSAGGSFQRRLARSQDAVRATRTSADQIAASRQAINPRISSAKQAGDNATVGHLIGVRDALDAQVNAAVPEAGQFNRTYPSMSCPLDLFQPGQSVDAVPKAVARDNFANFNGTPPSQIPDTFLRGEAAADHDA
jgi:hypothetical protein